MSQQSGDHKQGRYVEYGNQPGQVLYGAEECCGAAPSFGDMYGDAEMDALAQFQWYPWVDGAFEGQMSGLVVFQADPAPEGARLVVGDPGAGVYDIVGAGYARLPVLSEWGVAICINDAVSRMLIEVDNGAEQRWRPFAFCGRERLEVGDSVSLKARRTDDSGGTIVLGQLDVKITRVGM